MSKTHLQRLQGSALYLEEEGESSLFSSILKRLQSEISQHVGDTSRGAVFVILVDEVSCPSLAVF